MSENTNQQQQQQQQETNNQNNVLIEGDAHSIAKSKDAKTLNSIKNKISRQISEIQNTEALENSRLQSTLNSLVPEMSKYKNAEKEYNDLAPKVEAAKKATASKLEALQKQIQLCNDAINVRLQAGEMEIQKNIASMSASAANEGFKKFTAGKTPDQDANEQGEKGFQSSKGKEVESPDLKKQDQSGKKV